MIMKLKVFGMLALLSAVVIEAKAQDYGADEAECKKWRSIYGMLFNDGKYREAIPAWQKAIALCPKSGEDLYTNGRYAYRNFLLKDAQTAKEDAKVKELQDSIIWLAEQHIEYYGKDMAKIGKLAQDYMEFDADAHYKKAYPILREILETNKEKASYYDVLIYFQSVFKKRQKKDITDDAFINEYLWTLEFIDESMLGQPDQKAQFESVIANIERMLIAVLKDCDAIDKAMSKVYESLPTACEDRAPKLAKFIDFMKSRKCEDAAAYSKFAEEFHKCNPSHQSAYNLAGKYLKEKNNSEALKYLKEATDLCKDCDDMAKYQLSTAKLYKAMGNCSAAMQMARTVGPRMPEAYEIVAQCLIQLYASTCGNDIIARKSIYWLASDYMQKAGKGADYYKSNFPETSELFSNGVNTGSSYVVPCVGESTTVRAK